MWAFGVMPLAMGYIWRPKDEPEGEAERTQRRVTVSRPLPASSRSLGYVEYTNAPPAAAAGPRYGVVDTTFSTVNMGDAAAKALVARGVPESRIARRTVPGFKDLAVAAKILIERHGCIAVVACGMVGPEPIDKQCAHEASLAIAQAQLMTNTHILECFVHMDEAKDDGELIRVAENRAAEHAVNAYWLSEAPEELARRAGTGQRQGFSDVGAADAKRTVTTHLRPSTR
jgi:riboflavin synthase